jgi:hypothetical protein
MERTEMCNFTRQHLLGSKHLDISMRTLSTKEDLYWKSKVTNAKKVNQLLHGKSTTVRIRDGLSSMVKMMVVTFKEKEKMATSDSSSMKHSMHGAKVTPK